MGLSSDDTRRREVVRDLAAGALLIGALFFPWNLYFGFRIPDSSKTVFGLLLAVTSLSLASLAVTFAGRRSQLRLGLNVPYLLLVLAFVVFDAIQTIRLGGTVHVPGGVGPGGWLGITGALLSAQPALTGATTDEGSHSRWLRATQFLGYASMLGAALSTGFNLSWRVRYALEPAAGASGFGKQNLAVIDTAVVYGVVALAAVLVASRWLLRPTAAEALSTVALGGSTLIAGSIVWSLPIGREIDAFHGIAQNTSTAGVGYEGYLVWAAAACVCAADPVQVPERATDRQNRVAGSVPKRLAAHRRVVPGLGSDAVDRPRRRGAVELSVLALRQHGAGCVRSGHRGPSDLASLQHGDRGPAREADLVAVRIAMHIHRFARHRRRRPGSAIPGIFGRVGSPRLRKRSCPADHQHLRCGAVRPGAQHPRGGHRHRQAAPAAATPHTPALSRPAGSPRIFRSAGSTHPVRPKIYRPPDHSS